MVTGVPDRLGVGERWESWVRPHGFGLNTRKVEMSFTRPVQESSWGLDGSRGAD